MVKPNAYDALGCLSAASNHYQIKLHPWKPHL